MLGIWRCASSHLETYTRAPLPIWPIQSRGKRGRGEKSRRDQMLDKVVSKPETRTKKERERERERVKKKDSIIRSLLFTHRPKSPTPLNCACSFVWYKNASVLPIPSCCPPSRVHAHLGFWAPCVSIIFKRTRHGCHRRSGVWLLLG